MISFFSIRSVKVTINKKKEKPSMSKVSKNVSATEGDDLKITCKLSGMNNSMMHGTSNTTINMNINLHRQHIERLKL